MEETQISSLEQLTLLQQELGYKQGDISTVALLGLLGEAGEVLAEVELFNIGGLTDEVKKALEVTVPFNLIDATKKLCRDMDDMKKKVRKGEFNIKTAVANWNDFDAELADVFYYVNILALNRGLTIEDLARMSHDKVRAKQASGGSSEDRK